jgi:hypothetical protein
VASHIGLTARADAPLELVEQRTSRGVDPFARLLELEELGAIDLGEFDALAGASELAARALASQGIRVNAIAPSLMLRSPGQSEENFAAMHRANPLQRGVEPADVVAALRYLIAAPAVTGQTRRQRSRARTRRRIMNDCGGGDGF